MVFASGLLRARLVVVRRVDEAKKYMESGATGLVARTIVVDVSMPTTQQSAGMSRILCKAPPGEFLKQLADDVKRIPASQVVGHVLLRSCHQNVERFHDELATTRCHRRLICVPVTVPSAFLRYIRSAASRS